MGEEREAMGDEPEEKEDVEGHYLGDAPSSDAPSWTVRPARRRRRGPLPRRRPELGAPSLDRDTGEGADVEGHYFSDAPSTDAPSSD